MRVFAGLLLLVLAGCVENVTAPGGPSVLSTPEGRKMLHDSFAGNGTPPHRD